MSAELRGSFIISFRKAALIRIVSLTLIGLAVLSGTSASVALAGAAPGPTKSPVCAFAALIAVGLVAKRILR